MIENANQWCVLPATTSPRILYNPLFINLMKVIAAFESLCAAHQNGFYNSVLLDFGAGISQGWVFTCQNGSGLNWVFSGWNDHSVLFICSFQFLGQANSAVVAKLMVLPLSSKRHCLYVHLIDFPFLFLAGDITQKGYEKKRSKLIGAYLPQPPGMCICACNRWRCQGYW